MTNIFLHGVLAKEFGSSFRINIHKASNAINAIDANRASFNKRILDLAREGLNYTMIVDGKKITELQELEARRKPQEIHLVPLIVGSGPIGIGTAIVKGVGALFVGTAAASAFAATAGGVLLSTIVGGAVLTAVSIGLMMLLAPKPDAGPPISASTKALQESFGFSNKANVASQGSPVPVGYGRLKVGSQVIQVSQKSYPQNRESTVAMRREPFGSDTASDTAQSISNRG